MAHTATKTSQLIGQSCSYCNALIAENDEVITEDDYSRGYDVKVHYHGMCHKIKRKRTQGKK